MATLAVITIGIDPEIHLGPLTLTWHGLTIALGTGIGGLIAARWLHERRLSTEPLYSLAVVLIIGAIVGSRLFYVLEHGGAMLGTHGFTFFGGVILAAALLALYVWRTRLTGLYLDAIAVGLPLGVAVGRIGDPQWTSLGILAVVVAGWSVTRRRRRERTAAAMAPGSSSSPSI